MYKKILRTSSFLGILIFAAIPAKSIQRFAIQEDNVYVTSNGLKMPSRITSLEFRNNRYLAMPNRRAKGYLEFNIAPDNELGPKPIYGEKVTVRIESDYQQRQAFIWSSWKTEAGHPTIVDMPAILALAPNTNPECVILQWSPKNNCLLAFAKVNN
jgi:hypothetical protein